MEKKVVFSGIFLFLIVGIGSSLIKSVNFPIGPKYFVSFFENKNSIKQYLKDLPKTGSILTSYGVHGVRGMNVQQKSGLDYVLPSQNLSKYYFNKKLKTIGCYEKANLNVNWKCCADDVDVHRRRCAAMSATHKELN